MALPVVEDAFKTAEDHLVATGSLNTQIEAFLARHLAVLIYSQFQTACEEALRRCASRIKSHHATRYIESVSIHQLRRLKIEDLSGVLGHFGADVQEVFSLRIKDSASRIAYEAVLAHRHLTAHGPGANVTLADLKKEFHDSIGVLDAFEAALALIGV